MTDRWISKNGEMSRIPPDYSTFLDIIAWEGWDLVETAKNRLQTDLICMESSISGAGRPLMVPSNAKPGDIIVILGGGKVPFILRQLEDLNKKYYRLVGEWYMILYRSLINVEDLADRCLSYVHGMMDGEALRNSDEKDEEYTLI